MSKNTTGKGVTSCIYIWTLGNLHCIKTSELEEGAVFTCNSILIISESRRLTSKPVNKERSQPGAANVCIYLLGKGYEQRTIASKIIILNTSVW